jgi:AcrR family transcriptional regulator
VLFARNGISNTSIRAVAAAAGVDSALVHHYFGTKEKLFAAAVRIPIDPMDVLRPLRETPVEELGHKIPSMLLPLWDSEMGVGFIATLRSILAGSEVNLFRSFIQDVIAEQVGSRVDNPPGTGIIRIQFVASQLVGVVMARYILDLEPFKSLPATQIVETIAPNLQRYLTGDLPELPAP